MNNLKYIYSSIKNNNLDKFKQLTENINLKSYVNNINENFLFYSLDKGSYDISKYLIDCYPDLLLTKNKYLLTPFSNIVFNNNIKGLKCFLKIQNQFNISMEKLVNLGGNTYTIPLLAIEKLNKQNWKIFEVLTESFWHSSNLSAKDLNGYNIAHKLAIDNKDYAISILKHLDDALFYQSDNKLNLTPIFYASQFSSFNLFKEILKKSNIQDKNLLNSNLIHASIFNKDINVLKLLTTELSNINIKFLFDKNAYGDSPLMTAINNKNIEATNYLFKFYIDNKIDISDELIQYVKNFQKSPTVLKKYFQHLSLDNIKSLISSEEKIVFLFSYLFFHFSEKDFIKTKKQLKLLDNINNKNIFFSHQLYSASILSKKDIYFKFKMLFDKFKILNSNHSEKYFSYDTSSNKLFFHNYDYQLFNKPSKVFSFISLINTLPNNQLNDFINNFNILDNLDNNDLVYLFFIAIKKQIIPLLDILKNKKYSVINENTFLVIQDLLLDYKFNENNLENLNIIFNTFPRTPNYLMNNISNNYLNNKSLDYLNNYIYMFKKNEHLKKNLFLNVLYSLYSRQLKDDEYFKFLLSNENLIVSSFKNISIDKLNNVKLSSFFKKSFLIYCKRENPIFILLHLASSENTDKNELINFILPYCTFNSSVFGYIKNNLNLNLDNQMWSILFKKIEPHNLIDLCEIYLKNTSINNLNINLVDDKISKDKIINYILSQKKIDLYKLELINNKFEINVNEIFNNSLIYENIDLLNYCISKDVNLINQCDYLKLLENINLNNIDIDFQDDLLFNNNKLNIFFTFISEQNENINNENKEIILNHFIENLKNNKNINHQVSIRIINTLLNTFNESISQIKDSLLVDICKYFILKNNILSNDEFNNIFTIIFDKKENKVEFFNLLNEEKDFKKNITYLPSKQQSLLFLNELNKDTSFNTNKTKNIKIKKI